MQREKFSWSLSMALQVVEIRTPGTTGWCGRSVELSACGWWSSSLLSLKCSSFPPCVPIFSVVTCLLDAQRDGTRRPRDGLCGGTAEEFDDAFFEQVLLLAEMVSWRLIIWSCIRDWTRARECELIVAVLTRIYQQRKKKRDVGGTQFK